MTGQDDECRAHSSQLTDLVWPGRKLPKYFRFGLENAKIVFPPKVVFQADRSGLVKFNSCFPAKTNLKKKKKV
jgi:hypothetical protein